MNLNDAALLKHTSYKIPFSWRRRIFKTTSQMIHNDYKILRNYLLIKGLVYFSVLHGYYIAKKN
jgi:hypothetical protein